MFTSWQERFLGPWWWLMINDQCMSWIGIGMALAKCLFAKAWQGMRISCWWTSAVWTLVLDGGSKRACSVCREMDRWGVEFAKSQSQSFCLHSGSANLMQLYFICIVLLTIHVLVALFARMSLHWWIRSKGRALLLAIVLASETSRWSASTNGTSHFKVQPAI